MPKSVWRFTCERCGDTFVKVAYPSYFSRGFPRFCTRTCHLRTHNESGHNERIARSTIKQRADAKRGIPTGRGNSYTKRGGRHEHRAIMETIIGRSLLSTEIVHHKDGDNHNNAIDNLEIVTREWHIKHHIHGKGH